MTTPALQRLRERFPQAQIALLTEEKLADLWDQHACVDKVITARHAENPLLVARRLRNYHFEAALILPNSPRSALEVWLAGIPRRVGYAARWRKWCLTQPLEYPADRVRLRRRRVGEVKRLVRLAESPGGVAGGVGYVHQMNDYLHLVAALGSDSAPLPPRLEVSAQEAEAAVVSCLSGLRAYDAPATAGQEPFFLGLNPSAAYGPAKCWPAERFAEVTRQVSQRLPNCTWLIFGARTDWDVCEKLAALGAGRTINLAGKTTLRQLMALLKTCRVLLTNDSGPMHLAAALGTPVVAPFGSTSPELTGPGQPGDVRHRVLRANAPCSPCFRRTCPIDFRCMTGITPGLAVAAILESLNMNMNSRLDGGGPLH
jgi:heptosyltransferase-2